MPKIKLTTTSTRKIKKIVLAIETAPAAIPPKPNIAAIIAITRKVTVHFNIKKVLKVEVNMIALIVIVRFN